MIAFFNMQSAKKTQGMRIATLTFDLPPQLNSKPLFVVSLGVALFFLLLKDPYGSDNLYKLLSKSEIIRASHQDLGELV